MACSKCNRDSTSGRYKKTLCHSCYNTQWGANSETAKQKQHEYYLKNKEKIIARSRTWEKANKEKKNSWQRAYVKKYPERHAARQAKRIARLKERTPKWADVSAIKQFYRRCPVGHHVDHIIPLNGKNVSGLHVLANIQYLPAKKNLEKSNSFGGSLE